MDFDLKTTHRINFDNPNLDNISDFKIDITIAKSRLYYGLLLKSNFEPPIAMAKWAYEKLSCQHLTIKRWIEYWMPFIIYMSEISDQNPSEPMGRNRINFGGFLFLFWSPVPTDNCLLLIIKKHLVSIHIILSFM